MLRRAGRARSSSATISRALAIEEALEPRTPARPAPARARRARGAPRRTAGPRAARPPRRRGGRRRRRARASPSRAAERAAAAGVRTARRRRSTRGRCATPTACPPGSARRCSSAAPTPSTARTSSGLRSRCSSRRSSSTVPRATAAARPTHSAGSCRYLSCRGQLADAEAAAEGAIELLALFPPGPELARAYAGLALLRLNQDDFEATLRAGARAIELAEAAGDAATALDATITIGTCELLRDGPGAQRHAGAGARSSPSGTSTRRGPSRALHNLGYVATLHRSHDAREPLARRGDRALRRARARPLAARDARQPRTLRARPGALDGGRGDGRAVDRREPRLAPPAHRRARHAGLVRARRGDPGTRELVDEASGMPGAAEDFERAAPIAAALAEIAWLGGRAEDVRGLTQRTLRAGGRAPARPGGRASSRSGGSRHGIVDELPDGVAEPWALQLAGDWRGAADAPGRPSAARTRPRSR